MSAGRNEVRTGLFVLITLTAFIAILIYLGAPGAFKRQTTYYVYFATAYGIKPGADVMVAGRKVGQVQRIWSPVPLAQRPEPRMESLIEVRVSADAGIRERVRVQMVQLSMLGDMMIDFSDGDESSPAAAHGSYFRGERQPGLSEAVPEVLKRLDPVIQQLNATLSSMRQATHNLATVSADNGHLQLSLAEYHRFAIQMNALLEPEGSLNRSLKNVEAITGPEGSLARTLKHTDELTARLTENRDWEVALQQMRQASEKLNRAVSDFSPSMTMVGRNLEQASDTVKHQPWRLIWPTTKRYPQESSLRKRHP